MLREFTYKAIGKRGKQKVIAVCPIAASMKISHKGEKLVPKSLKETDIPFFEPEKKFA